MLFPLLPLFKFWLPPGTRSESSMTSPRWSLALIPTPRSQTESIWVWPAFQVLCCVPSWTAGPWWMASHQCQDQGEAPRECLAIQDPHLTSPSGCTRWGPRGSGRGRFAGGSRRRVLPLTASSWALRGRTKSSVINHIIFPGICLAPRRLP